MGGTPALARVSCEEVEVAGDDVMSFLRWLVDMYTVPLIRAIVRSPSRSKNMVDLVAVVIITAPALSGMVSQAYKQRGCTQEYKEWKEYMSR